MSDSKRLPLFVLGNIRKGPMISFRGRMLLYLVPDGAIFVVLAVALVLSGSAAMTGVLEFFGGLFILVAVGGYLFWYPKYRKLNDAVKEV